MHWTDERLIQVDPMCTLGDGPGGVRVWKVNYAANICGHPAVVCGGCHVAGVSKGKGSWNGLAHAGAFKAIP